MLDNKQKEKHLMTSLLLTINLLLHAAFIWGRFAVFRVGDRLPEGAKLIQIVVVPFILLDALLIAGRAGNHSILDALAIALALFSSVLFAWAVRTTGLRRLRPVFSEDLPSDLIVSGPFRFVRNPFYLAYVLAYLQALVASRSWWAACPLAVMAFVYYRAALLEERKFLSGGLALQYRCYAATTGRFLPMLISRSRGPRRPLTEL